MLLQGVRGTCAATLACMEREDGRTDAREQGVATVEMAFVLPILLMLTLGTATLAHAVITRFLMHSAAYDAARTCALARVTTPACVTSVISQKLALTTKWCTDGVKPKVFTPPAGPGLESVNVLEVQLTCDFVGGVGTKYLSQRGLTIATITARAAMPY